MKTKALLLLCACLIVFYTFAKTKEGSGKTITKTFQVNSSNHIILKSIQLKRSLFQDFECKCRIILRNQNEVKITTDNTIIADLSLVNQNNITTVSYKGTCDLQPSKLYVEIYTNKLALIQASGICKINLEGALNSEQLSIDLSGATELSADSKLDISKCRIELSGASKMKMRYAYLDNLILDLAGASKLELEGSAKMLSADIAGSTEAELRNFEVENIRGEASGASVCNLYCKNKIYWDVAGASKTKVEGTCDNAKFEVTGAASLNAINLKAKDVIIDTSGASSAQIYALRSLNAESSGTSSIKYKGNPSEVSKDQSGLSKIHRL